MECVIVGGIDVRFGSGHNNFYFIRVLPCLNDAEISADFVVPLCTPRNIVHVGELWGRIRVSKTRCTRSVHSPTYRIYIQDVDVSRRHQKVLEEGGDHVPRFKLSFC